MSQNEAVQLAATINNTPYQPKTRDWWATVKLLARQREDGRWDGQWGIVLTHPFDERSFLLFSEQEWQRFQERDDEPE